ncbi:MAG: recombinase family protein, partial [Christensenellales bacterium]
MKKIVIYARYSSDRQTEQSIEGQLRVCHEYAERNDYVVVHEYIDRALSGTTDRRPAFLQMIEESKKKEFEFVLVYQLDRFARNRYDSANYKMKLKKNGVRVLSARENISDDASGILMESVLEGIAEYYSIELSQKVKRGVRESLMKGNFTGGQVTYGYKIENKKWVIDEDHAKFVRQAFQEYSRGEKATEIADHINTLGSRTLGGKKWDGNSIAKMLHNPRYMGTLKFGDEIFTDVIPPIVEEKLWQVVNGMMENYRRNYKKDKYDPYFLTGKIFCGYCGESVIAESGSSHLGTRYKYYKCHTKKVKGKACELRNYRKQELEQLIIEKTKQYILTPTKIDEIAHMVVDKFNEELSNNVVLKCLEKELKQINNKINSLVKNMEQGVVTVSIRENLYKLENDRADIQLKIAEEKTKIDRPLNFEDVKNFLTLFASKEYEDVFERNEFFNRFIKKIILFNDK